MSVALVRAHALSFVRAPALRVCAWVGLGAKPPRYPIPTASRTTGCWERLSSLLVHFSSGSGKWTGVVLSTDNMYRLRVYNNTNYIHSKDGLQWRAS